jgi:glycosyltransferase involved in cell wall biosynthesis
MKISVICPTYNSGFFLSKTLDTILAQTFTNFECIISDDGSVDETIQIANQYKELFKKKFIEFNIIKNKHVGPGFARNRGIDLSKYEWISFIDSDDTWEPTKLERVVKIIELSQGYNCILHRQNFIKLNGTTRRHDFDNYFNPNTSVHKQIFKTNFFAMSAVSIKKKIILDHGGFNENYQNAQDYDLWLKIGDAFKIYIIKDYLGNNIEREGNITSRSYLRRIKNLFLILNRNKKKVSFFLYAYRMLRIFLSKEWLKFFFR